MSKKTAKNIRSVVVVAGTRTPFCRAGGALSHCSAVKLGAIVSRETMLRAGVRPDRVEQIIFGIVTAPIGAPNIAREIGLEAAFPASIPAYTVSKACISSNQAITNAADQIALGKADVVLAGGAEVLSDIPILYGRTFRDALFEASKAKTMTDQIKAFLQVRPRDLAPVAPAIAEPSSGQTMGEAAEKMAKYFHIKREGQDRFAAHSHARAIAAWERGDLARHVVPVPVSRGGNSSQDLVMVGQDDHPRKDSTLDKLARLRPVFDPQYGSVTAGNSSPLTDGASAILLAAEEVAASEGWPILGRLTAYSYSAIDPFEHLLMGPVSAIAKVLEQSNLELKNMDVIEMHEAFAAQVLANIHGLASADYCHKLGLDKPIGEIDPEFVNQWGGSISLGHPFGATGGRLVIMCSDQLAQKNKQFGLISACAAGGMGSAMIFERIEK